MDFGPRNSAYVAPLTIKKTPNGFITSAEGSIQLANTDPGFVRPQFTPPLTPRGSNESMAQENQYSPPVFHNYLRAFYHFQPANNVSSTTVTLPLNQGDVILVHSVHTNGWADGTLLETGDRGWLPTNYCEPYDPSAMRYLLNALTEFWDIIRCASLTTLDVFQSQDYMRGLIAGVRFLLENSKCLTRDTVLVRSHENLRRVRKAILSDLSSLVKIAKRLQDIANNDAVDQGVDELLDEMLLKAFKIVTRGVTFLDMWNDISKPPENLTVAGAFAMAAAAAAVPLTPPAAPSPAPSATRPQSALQHAATALDSPRAASSLGFSNPDKRDSGLGTPLSAENAPTLQQDTLDTNPGQRNRTSLSHRVSYVNKPSGATFSLVSSRLGSSYDAFLSVLGSFIGLHMQSRSSTDLLVTTQQAVKSCRQLMTLIEAVMKRDGRRNEVLRKSKETMVDKITDLARAAQDAFRPLNSSDGDLVFMPEDGERLVDAATACVRAAGECVAHTRHVLEQIGDFELELAEPPRKRGTVKTQEPTKSPQSSVAGESDTKTNDTVVPQPPRRPSAPRLVIPSVDLFPSSPLQTSFTAGSHLSSTFTASATTAVETPLTGTSSFSNEIPPTPPPKPDIKVNLSHSRTESREQNTASPDARSESRAVTSTGSHSTIISSARDSGMSHHSLPSTVATSFDHGIAGLTERFSGSHMASADETDETEAKMLETSYAHELCLKDGRVVGGSLRALIEKLTAYDSAPDPEFVSAFYLTFRLFATPLEFAQSLADRFESVGINANTAGPVRLRVYNSLKGWLEGHWRHDCDNAAMPFILDFTRNSLIPVLNAAGRRLFELAERVCAIHGPAMPRLMSSVGKTNTAIAQYISPDTPIPAAVISKSQLATLRQWKETGATISILDFDPLEFARQLTIKESQIFCSILPEELLATEWTKQTGSLAVNVRAMSTLSTDLASLVADSILQQDDAKKRAAIVKQWIKIANKCLELNNFDSLMAIYCALTNSTITRMKRTWELVSQKNRTRLETLGSVVDVSKNHTSLRHRLQNLMPPCLPFVGMYLTDLTFVDHGNPATRQMPSTDGTLQVINFDKHVKTAKIISDLQRFQVPYRLTEIPELQTWLQDQLIRVRSNGDKSFQHFYRRSLVLEPKDMLPRRASPLPGQQAPQKERFDFLNWTHGTRDK